MTDITPEFTESICRIVNDPGDQVQLFSSRRINCMAGHNGYVTVRVTVPDSHRTKVAYLTAGKFYDRFCQPRSVEELRKECWDLYQTFWKGEPND